MTASKSLSPRGSPRRSLGGPLHTFCGTPGSRLSLLAIAGLVLVLLAAKRLVISSGGGGWPLQTPLPAAALPTATADAGAAALGQLDGVPPGCLHLERVCVDQQQARAFFMAHNQHR